MLPQEAQFVLWPSVAVADAGHSPIPPDPAPVLPRLLVVLPQHPEGMTPPVVLLIEVHSVTSMMLVTPMNSATTTYCVSR